jgi:hypothetical protein
VVAGRFDDGNHIVGFELTSLYLHQPARSPGGTELMFDRP